MFQYEEEDDLNGNTHFFLLEQPQAVFMTECLITFNDVVSSVVGLAYS